MADATKPAALVPYTDVLLHRDWIVFQDKVYDMSAFAPTHPGGAQVSTGLFFSLFPQPRPLTIACGQLITDHANGDGTVALKGAHPGGVKFIKHKLTAQEHGAAYKVRPSVGSPSSCSTHQRRKWARATWTRRQRRG